MNLASRAPAVVRAMSAFRNPASSPVSDLMGGLSMSWSAPAQASHTL